MSLWGVAAILLLALSGVLLGDGMDRPLALVWTAVLSVSAIAAVQADVGRRLRRLTAGASSWLATQRFAALPVRDRGAWGQHVVLLNALGAAHERRGAKLARERPWRRALVDALVSPALLFSSDGRLLSANAAARDLLGVPTDAGDVTVLRAVGSEALAEAVREVQLTGVPVTVDTTHGEHELRGIASQVGDEALLIVVDRTREQRIEDLRRNFVVNASHELKTPVTGIRTLAEALRVTADAGDLDRLRPLLGRLDAEADRLARLVHDLLDLRRLEERGPLERVPVDVAELARRVAVELLDRAEERGVELSIDAPDRAYLAGVPGDLEAIVKNLAANAVQYNREGGRVEVLVTPEGGSQIITVRDTGIGIPAQDLSRIFERFYRVDPARSRASGGTGLGLAIVRHAVESHRGSIEVESTVGEGTTFTVTLPIEAA
ncbi:MAG: ATP-binding protein [Nitriliruptor sp.]|uniref:sensor histidine kinase n=1 Tax=Nitriliruptor sp. TaxID=2448056 RepID=UPI0034A02D79